MKTANEDERWNAVVHKDARADGKFVFSVKTTGIYCRPSCSAKLALRKNVMFHDSCEKAENHGFRACKRCQPNGLSLPKEHALKVAEACRLIENAEKEISLGILAKRMAMSKFHFHRVFKKVTGLSPKDYFKALRANRMRKELPQRHTVTEAIYQAGFNSNGGFYSESAKMLGMTAKKFQNRGAQEKIRFAVKKCSLGFVLVGASEIGICAISLGDDPDKLVLEFKDSFCKAQLVWGDSKFEQLISRVIGLVDSPMDAFDLPLDIRGTAFQRRVWKALSEIPAGSTQTYTEVAKRIGSPKSVRAVAGACAANLIAVAIPCHRVVRNGGTLSGYRWGVERKRALLGKEKVQSNLKRAP